jgi:hypothetical protein
MVPEETLKGGFLPFKQSYAIFWFIEASKHREYFETIRKVLTIIYVLNYSSFVPFLKSRIYNLVMCESNSDIHKAKACSSVVM